MSQKPLKKILFIASHRLNRSPNQRFRFEQYLPVLEQEGFQWELSYLIDEEWDRTLYGKGKYWSKARFLLHSYKKRKKDLQRLEDYDIVFVAREAMMFASTYFEKAFSRADVKFILDFDDAIWLPNASPNNARFSWVKGSRKVYRNFRYADLVIAGNEYLASHARPFNPNVEVFPTTIDTAYHRPLGEKKEEGPMVIGWTGSPSTVQHFELAVPALKRIKKRYGNNVTFKLIGDPHYSNEELEMEGVAWSYKDEIEELNEIDIGIMPLPHNEWSKGKCALKALQFMALKIPAVVSPIGVNTEIVQDGVNGFLASEEDQWVHCLERLIDEPELRKELGENARNTVEEHYSVEANKERYLKLLDAT